MENVKKNNKIQYYRQGSKKRKITRKKEKNRGNTNTVLWLELLITESYDANPLYLRKKNNH